MAIQLPVIKTQGRWKSSPTANERLARDAHDASLELTADGDASAHGPTSDPVDGHVPHAPKAPRSSLLVRTLRVGELSRQSGKTVRALHLYEERGLLDPIERSKGGYRLYAQDALVRVRWISKLQDMGFSLNDIQSMLRQWERSGSAPRAMLQVGEVLKEKLEETREQIARLQSLENELRSSLEYLETCPKCSPQQELTACTSCELHGQGEAAPDLVAGFHAH
jgi:DNA-binding transcriptional MerR regulator